MKLKTTIMAMAAAVCCSAITSQAALVLPPGTASAPLGPDVPLDGTAVTITTLVSPFTGIANSGPSPFSGILTTTVLQESLAFNPLGGYTFVYSLVDNSTSSDTLARFTVDGWKNASATIVVGN